MCMCIYIYIYIYIMYTYIYMCLLICSFVHLKSTFGDTPVPSQLLLHARARRTHPERMMHLMHVKVNPSCPLCVVGQRPAKTL